jgi:hypothetical protein
MNNLDFNSKIIDIRNVYNEYNYLIKGNYEDFIELESAYAQEI